jgi:hypothetical protein
MARLHNHAGRWRLPPGFVRIRWDRETFSGDTMVYGGRSGGFPADRIGPCGRWR